MIRLVRQLTASGYLRIEGFEFPVLELTPKGAAVLAGTAPLVWNGGKRGEGSGAGS